MIVCSCHAVSSRALDRCIAAGAHTLEAVGRACRAGTDCGSCRRDIVEHLRAQRHVVPDAPQAEPEELAAK